MVVGLGSQAVKTGNGLKLSLLAGGLSLGASLAYLYYQRSNQSNAGLEVSKETVLKVLKEFKREFYVVFKNLTIASQNIQNQYRANYNVPAQDMKNILNSFLIDENPTLGPQIQDIEQKVYAKFEVINRVEFERLCSKLAKTNNDVKELMNEIKELFKKAILGIPHTPEINLSAEFSPEAVLTVFKDSIKEVLVRVMAYVRAYVQENGGVGLQDEKFHMGLQELSLDTIKNKTLINSGLPLNEEYHPQQVFAYAMSKYGKTDPKFTERVGRIEKFNQEIMQKMFMPNADFDKIEQEIVNIEEAFKELEPVIQLIEDIEQNKEMKDSPFEELPAEELVQNVDTEKKESIETQENENIENTTNPVNTEMDSKAVEEEKKTETIQETEDKVENGSDENLNNFNVVSSVVQEDNVKLTLKKEEPEVEDEINYESLQEEGIINPDSELLDISDN